LKPRRRNRESGAGAAPEVMLAARTVDAARVTFVVRPHGEVWEIALGSDGACFIYETRTEALLRAKHVARRFWEDPHEMTRVRTEDAQGRLRTLSKFGP
jgi:hypothetical protein